MGPERTPSFNRLSPDPMSGHKYAPQVEDPELDPEFLAEMNLELEKEWKAERRAAIRAARKQKCEHSDDYPISRLAGWFYAWKAIICIKLNWWHPHPYDYDYVDRVAVFWEVNAGGEYGGLQWEQLSVGRGIFRNWTYSLLTDYSH